LHKDIHTILAGAAADHGRTALLWMMLGRLHGHHLRWLWHRRRSRSCFVSIHTIFHGGWATLDLATDHLADQRRLSSVKVPIRMAVAPLFTAMEKPFKTPKITLALEGLEIW
jgi:hypothetical protein